MEAFPNGRKLVVCCDGTNNTLTAGTEDTNVLKLHTLLCNNRKPEHVLYYDPGVGTPDSIPPTDLFDWAKRVAERVGGLASGRGVYDNIAQAYLFLMREWRDDRDQIYCFGFSRGAFTARCVAGMVNLFGVLRPEHEAMLPTLIRVYFSQPDGAKGGWSQLVRKLHRGSARQGKAAAETAGHTAETRRVTRAALAEQISVLFAAGRQPDIHWIGVWDTVESVGLPGPLARSNPATATLAGKPKMRNARHALSLDEHRWAFEPRLYDEPGDIATERQTLKQRWFPGVHCDVGGSYRHGESGLPDAAFVWMVNEVAADLDMPRLPAAADARLRHDALWDTPWWALAGMGLRNMQPALGSGQAFHAVEDQGGSVAAPSQTVWNQRRNLWPVAVAVLLGGLFLCLSGLALQQGWQWQWPWQWRPVGVQDAAWAARDFAAEQLHALPWLHGTVDPAGEMLAHAHPAWAMFWDLLCVACWGYVLARIASRAYARLAGARRATSVLPAWRWLGFAPLAAVGGAVAKDMVTLLALAATGAGAHFLATGALWLVGVASVCTWLGLIACLPLLAVRLWLALPGVKTLK